MWWPRTIRDLDAAAAPPSTEHGGIDALAPPTSSPCRDRTAIDHPRTGDSLVTL